MRALQDRWRGRKRSPGLRRRKGAVSKAPQARIDDAQLGENRRHSGLVHVPVLLRLARPARPAGRGHRATCSRSASGAAARRRCSRPIARATRSSTCATSGWTSRPCSAPSGRSASSRPTSCRCRARRPTCRPSSTSRPCTRRVRWFHIDGEHTGTAVYRELEFANRIVNTEGIVVIDDFFSPRYPANTTEVDPLPREEPVPLPPARGRFQQGLSLPSREPAALHGLHGLGHVGGAFRATAPRPRSSRPPARGTPTPSASPTIVDDAGPIAGPDNEPQRWHMMRTRHVWGPMRHLQNGWRMLHDAGQTLAHPGEASTSLSS